jgi:TPR repeat protein
MCIYQQANLAEMLLSGDGIAKNESEASAWYAAAAQQDFTDGMLGLGGCYERGEVPSDSPDDVSEPNLALASFW